jgi:hypothetical protein
MNKPSAERLEHFNIVQKCLLNGILVRKWVHNYLYEVMPFSQGAIYKGQGMWSNMWGLDEPGKDSQGFRGVNPTYLTTARLGGIFFEISPFKNSHDLL